MDYGSYTKYFVGFGGFAFRNRRFLENDTKLIAKTTCFNSLSPNESDGKDITDFIFVNQLFSK